MHGIVQAAQPIWQNDSFLIQSCEEKRWEFNKTETIFPLYFFSPPPYLKGQTKFPQVICYLGRPYLYYYCIDGFIIFCTM